jgi:hypothetical protein
MIKYWTDSASPVSGDGSTVYVVNVVALVLPKVELGIDQSVISLTFGHPSVASAAT